MGLVFWLPMTDGTAKNQGLADATITVNNVTVNASGKLGQCCVFDSTNVNSNIEISNYDLSSVFSGDWTVSFWIYDNKNGDRACYCTTYNYGGQNGIALEKKSSQQLRIWYRVGSSSIDPTTNVIVENQTWIHFTVVKVDDTVTVYKNGENVYSFTSPQFEVFPENKTAIGIGNDTRGSVTGFIGMMNDFRIYNNALSPREVKEISKGLVRHYPMTGVTPERLYGEDFTYVSGVPTISGNPIQFTSPGELPLENGVISWTPVQYGSGDPSTSNVRTIQAQPLMLFKCGKNLWNEEDFLYTTAIQKNNEGWYYATSAQWRAAFISTNGGLWHASYVCLPQITISFDYYTSGETSASNTLLVTSLYTDNTYETLYCTQSSEVRHMSFTSESGKIIKKIAFSYGISATVYIKNFQIELGDQDTGYEPFCGEVYNLGKNLIDRTNLEDGYLTSTGGINTSSSGWYHTDYIPITPGQTYTGSSISKGGSNTYYALYDANKSFSRAVKIVANVHPIFTAQDDEYYVRMSLRDLSNELDTAQLEEGFFTEYSDYVCNQIYGGSINISTGVLQKTYECITLNGSESWSVVGGSSGGAAYYRLEIGSLNYVVNNTTICDKLLRSSIGSANKNVGIQVYNSTSANKAFVSIRLDESNSDVKTWLAENPIQVAFQLGTPVTYNIPIQQIRTLLGANNIFLFKNASLTFTDPRAEVLGLNDGIVYDVSGYNNNAEITGTLAYPDDAPRYPNCTDFNGSSYIKGDALPAETKTISFWIKTTWQTISSGYQLVFNDISSNICAGFTNAGFISYRGTSNGSTGSYVNYSNLYTANEWNHFVIIKTGDNTRTVYVNGQIASNKSNSYFSGNKNNLIIGGRYYNTYRDFFTGQISDFRAYATELSEEDVLELYHTPISLANNGALLTQGEYVES